MEQSHEEGKKHVIAAVQFNCVVINIENSFISFDDHTNHNKIDFPFILLIWDTL